MSDLDYTVCDGTPWGPWYFGTFSECFFQIVILNIIAFYIIAGGVYRILSIWAIPTEEDTYTKLRMFEEIMCWAITGLTIATFVGRMISEHWHWFQVMGDGRDFCCWALCSAVVYLEYNRGLSHNWVIRGFWLLQFLVGAFIMEALSARHAHAGDEEYGPEFDVDVYIGRFILTTLLCISGLWLKQSSKTEYKPLFEKQSSEKFVSYGTKRAEFELEEENSRHPELSANIFSRIIFAWASPLMALGYEKTLEQGDLWENKPENKSEHLYSLMQPAWSAQLRLPSPSLTKAILNTFKKPIILGGIFHLMWSGSQFVGPLMLEQILNYLEQHESKDPNQWPLWFAFILVAGLFCGSVLGLLGNAWFFITTIQCGMNVRSTVVDMVYRKSLVLSNESRHKSTTGEIVNLQAVDANRLLMVVPFIHIGWSSTMVIITCIVLLWLKVGVSVLAGLGVMIICVPISSALFRRVGALQKVMLQHKDNRIRLINESLSGIRIIKFFGWENPFAAKIEAARLSEIRQLRKIQYFRAAALFLFTCTPMLVTLATFATYTLQGNVLTPSTAFTALALFSLLRMPLIQIPMVIGTIVECRVSLKRLYNFLTLDEIKESAVIRDLRPINGDSVIQIEGGKFSWNSDSSNPTLDDININIKRGQLVAIVGVVGSGKSSLLSAMLGELANLSGGVKVHGTVAYVSQQPWIQNSSLRDNILFGKPYSESKYRECIRVCELVQDLTILPNGDLTEIGEKGINLSGGQKQRVSLARALYQEADIYLLDSPLSAVDAHVGANLFNNLILGALYNTTRVLVTHQIDGLDRADNIYVLKNGRIAESGNYARLLESGLEFSAFLKKHGKEATSGNIDEDAKNNKKGGKSEKKAAGGKDEKSDVEKKAAGALMSVEEKKSGSVAWAVYAEYIKAVGGGFMIVVVVLAYLLSNLAMVSGDLWISVWSEDDYNEDKTVYYLRIYAAIGMTGGLLVLCRQILFARMTLAGGIHLHKSMLQRVLRAKMSFFDTTQVGRILNRFSKDMSSVDELIPMSLGMLLGIGTNIVSVIVVVASVTPIFLVVGLPVAYFYYFVQQYYLSSSREISRIESVTKSPIYNQFSETLNGISTIRAFKVQQQFIDENQKKIDENSRAFYALSLAARWLAIRLEIVCACLVAAVAAFVIVERDNISAGLAGASLTNVFSLTVILSMLVRQTVEVETQIVAVERIHEYSQIDEEGPYEVPGNSPPQSWPSKGQIVFQDLKMRYRENLDLVLRGISANIQPKEKIGVVGRTGSGKSSILLSLFRMVEPASGTIIIDDVDITKIGLTDLRSRLAIIPQDPTLFIGTIRSNLDPFEQHSDVDIWRVLEDVHLKEAIENSPGKLEAPVVENGENLSVGQRQLMCLGRALLRKAKILLMDEATASVDMETDSVIQQTIRDKFQDITVITIAHRINTILDSDRVIVMDQGKIIEIDNPQVLSGNNQSFFHEFLQESPVNQNAKND